MVKMVTGPVTPTMQSGCPPKMAKIDPVRKVENITCRQQREHVTLIAGGDRRRAADLHRPELRDAVLLRLRVEHSRERDRGRDRREEHEEGGGEDLGVEAFGPVGDVVRRAPAQVLLHLRAWHEREAPELPLADAHGGDAL